MIKSVRLVNWRSHKDTFLEFRAGTNLLVGIMGAGKSSVMEAISFALFGTFPALERRKLKLENIVRLNEPAARAILEFEWAGAAYRIERAIERSKKGASANAEIYKGGTLAEHGPTGVNTYVCGLLGVDYDLFTRAIYSEQNNIDYFLNLGPGKRKEEMDVLLGLDRFETARANVVTVINRIRSKRQTLEESFSRGKLAELESKEKALSAEYNALQASFRQVSESFAINEKEAAAASARFEELRKAREAHERLAREEVRITTRAESLEKDVRGKSADEASLALFEEKLGALATDMARQDASYKALESRISALSRESGTAEAGIRAALEAKKRLDLAKNEVSSALSGLDPGGLEKCQKGAEAALIRAESERKSIEHDLAELAESEQRLRPGLSECPLCMSRLSEDGISHVRKEKGRLISEKKKRIAEIGAQIAALRKENEGLSLRHRRVSLLLEKCSALEKEASAAALLEGKRAEIEKTLAVAIEERGAAASRRESILKDAESLRAKVSEAKAFIQKLRDIEAAKKALAEIKSGLAALNYEEKSYEQARMLAETARIGAERLQSSKKSLEAQIRMSGEMLSLIRSEHKLMEKTAGEVRFLADMEEQLAIYKNALLETQAFLRHTLSDAINTAMNELWPMFYPYRNYLALRLMAGEKDYLFEVKDNSGWKGLETVASGGERACAALALRVALAIVLTPKLGWLILDEPTHNLDAEAVEMLSSALEFKVPEVVKQTFVITHDEAFMGSEFASSYRLSRDKENDGETKASVM